jgi:hypothetical protein
MGRPFLCCSLIAVALWSAPWRAPAADWQQLLDGKDLNGWQHVGPGGFTVVDGLLETHGGMGLLWYTRRKIGNAVIRVVFKPVQHTSNSGVFIRIPDKPTEPWMPVNKGYEVQILGSADDFHCTGVLYSLTKAMARPQKDGQWNTMEITLAGPRTIVVLNGTKVTDYTEGEPVPSKKKWYEPDRGRRPDEGYIGLQNHSSDSVVYFKQVAVRPLNVSKLNTLELPFEDLEITGLGEPAAGGRHSLAQRGQRWVTGN